MQWLGAVQAQDYPAAKWGIGQRVRDCVDADVEEAFVEGRILRTHVLRPTWHFVMPVDIRWMLELTAPRVNAAMSYYDRQLELDGAVYGRSNAALARALQGGKQLTRAELARVLEEAGIAASGQRLGHIVMRAELGAVICSGALRGKQHTYALLDERAPGAKRLGRDEALAELARRYFTSHGPALVLDFAWWSGLTVADAKLGIEMVKQHLLAEDIGDKEYWFAPSRATARVNDPTIHLLPNYDEYLIAYRDHSASLSAPLQTGFTAMFDMLARHIVVLNGRVIGGWRRTVEKNAVCIETTLLAPLNGEQEEALRVAAERYARFLGMPVTVAPAP
ncbi:MAG TPA: winged helix DNA-binding domain-containing protein [Dehalococcoidia bacterium]|nr:winged helix DNA-binding domain-containing protein [Dehalococcoidia bacterium]